MKKVNPLDIIQVKKVECPWCKGKGDLVDTLGDETGGYSLNISCSNCNGMGYHIKPKRPSQLNISGRPAAPKDLKPSQSKAEAKLKAAIRMHDRVTA